MHILSRFFPPVPLFEWEAIMLLLHWCCCFSLQVIIAIKIVFVPAGILVPCLVRTRQIYSWQSEKVAFSSSETVQLSRVIMSYASGWFPFDIPCAKLVQCMYFVTNKLCSLQKKRPQKEEDYLAIFLREKGKNCSVKKVSLSKLDKIEKNFQEQTMNDNKLVAFVFLQVFFKIVQRFLLGLLFATFF